MNDGVQGGSPAFKHTFHYFGEMGMEAAEVELKVGFGKGEKKFWTNIFETPLTKRLGSDIKRFGTLLGVMNWLELVLGILPIWLTIKLFRFSKDFGESMVYALMALFLGTGNRTPYVPTAVLCRLFTDPLMRLWEYSDKSLLCSVPKMYAFPKLGEFYAKWTGALQESGVQFHFESTVERVLDRCNPHKQLVVMYKTKNGKEKVEVFDKVVFACEPGIALKILGRHSSWLERFALSGVPYYNDVTVTHTDVEYMRKYYHLDSSDPEIREWAPNDAKVKEYTPMYFIHGSEKDPSKVEMSFDCTRYQPQFDKSRPTEKHVFQTIFLNKDGDEHTWTKSEINPKEIVLEKWWHQLGHKWTHYLRTVPWLGFLNGRRGCYFTGSWTVVNMHEMAIVSGIASAIQIGAEYPQKLQEDPQARKLMRMFMFLDHHAWF